MRQQISSLLKVVNQQIAGGKAYRLGQMARSGFNVPVGFVISSEALTEITPSTAKQIKLRFDRLKTDLVAVRSSAINEDGADASWAGQLETILNCNRANLLPSVIKCIQSTGSNRARSYARQKGTHIARVAVIVQKMIQSDISGVAFSINPVTNNDQEIVIEAGLGLGEAVVMGQITPDTYRLQKKDRQIVKRLIAEQSKRLDRQDTGRTSWKATGLAGKKQKLTDNQIMDVAGSTVELEELFNYPVDIEWAISDDQLYILQARPISTYKSHKMNSL